MLKALTFILFFLPAVLTFGGSANNSSPQRDITFPVPEHQELLDNFIISFERIIGVL